MRILKLLIVITVAIAGLSMASRTVDFEKSNDEKKREQTILYSMMGVVDYLHYNPKLINDKLSNEIWKDYMEKLDPSKRLLTQSEINILDDYYGEIDDNINQFNYDFFDKSEGIIKSANERSHEIYKVLIDSDINIYEDEVFELDSDKLDWAKDELELTSRWRQFLKYNIVSKIDSYRDNEKYANTSLEELESKAVKDVKELFDDFFVRVSKTRRDDRLDEYLNTIIVQNDPHTVYFSPKDQENFEIRMGNKLEGIGAQLQQADEYIKIYSIVPGGPAWKGKELEVDDLIVSVQQYGEENILDITGMRLDDVIRKIRGPKGTKVTLRVKKKSGVYKNITIERDEIILDAAAAKSVIIGVDKKVNNIGYIHLPMFYSTFDGGNSCSTDVAKEIEKLKGENVEGIILDLRYNGGGSLPDAISMAGLFIEEGPIVQVKAREGKAEILKDEDSSVKYDGPLIVLVNKVSASSSEIVAGALQDYKRAIIVGGEQTYGKGSVQGLYDLDRMINGNDDVKPLGQVKVTTQKFYRVSGKSNQLKGIIPDIQLPDQFSYVKYGETDYDDALKYSEIETLEYNQDVYKTKSIQELAANSSRRVSENPSFELVKKYGQVITKNEEDTDIRISVDGYSQEMDLQEASLKPFENLMDDNVEGLLVKNLVVDQEYIEAEENRKARNIDFIEGLTKDIYLKECLMIMKDVLDEDKRIAQK